MHLRTAGGVRSTRGLCDRLVGKGGLQHGASVHECIHPPCCSRCLRSIVSAQATVDAALNRRDPMPAPDGPPVPAAIADSGATKNDGNDQADTGNAEGEDGDNDQADTGNADGEDGTVGSANADKDTATERAQELGEAEDVQGDEVAADVDGTEDLDSDDDDDDDDEDDDGEDEPTFKLGPPRPTGDEDDEDDDDDDDLF
jgi:hypothetical protein